MGLQNNLQDVSSDSIPLLLLLHLAAAFNFLRSHLLALLHSPKISQIHSANSNSPPFVDDALLAATIGSGLARLVILSDHLNATYEISAAVHGGAGAGEITVSDCSICVVCRNEYEEGDQVRRLPCRHVFHRRCFDAWLHQLKFNCPICRSELISDERVELASRRVGSEMLSWFSVR